jgi:type I restriction enzyme M protein
MLFLKVFDQREEEWEDDNPKYKSPLPEGMRWRNWAAYVPGADGKKAPHKLPTEIISFVNNELFPALKELDANQMKSSTQLLAVIEKLEEAINFHDLKTRASLGDVYEQMLNDLRGADNAGEFYTLREGV